MRYILKRVSIKLFSQLLKERSQFFPPSAGSRSVQAQLRLWSPTYKANKKDLIKHTKIWPMAYGPELVTFTITESLINFKSSQRNTDTSQE